MQLLSFVIESNNKKSICNFIKFLNFVIKNKFQKNKPKNKEKITINLLKSPHVHKNAQEQFKINKFKQNIFVFLPKFNINKILVKLKIIFVFFFHDIKLKINYFVCLKLKKKLSFLNLSFFFLNSKSFNKTFSFNKKNKTYCYLKLLNITGNILKKLVTQLVRVKT